MNKKLICITLISSESQATLLHYCTSGIAELGIYPAVDPLDSSSRILDPNVVGHEHYACARGVQKILQNYKSLQVSTTQCATAV